MPKAQANGIELEFETFGNPNSPPILLVMGLGGQLIHWDERFCQQLADGDHFVIRYDNRDVGLSTWFDEAGTPDVLALMAATRAGQAVEVPYTLVDMAADGMALLDALGIEKAHVCGVSMGGMIAQRMAIEYPERLLSLTSIMSSTGNPDLPPAEPEVMAKLLGPAPGNLEQAMSHAITMAGLVGSPGYPAGEDEIRAMTEQAFRRAFHPQGATRQLAAIASDGNRVEALGKLDLPCLVIHGRDDALVPFAAGLDTAEAIPGATTLWIGGMGHDMPQALWGEVIEAIHANATAPAGHRSP